MKIRIKDNSLRLRLTQGEVKTMEEDGKVAAQIQFGPTAEHILRYSLEKVAIAAPQVEYDASAIRVMLPIDQANLWATSDQISIATVIPIADQLHLDLLIEKDFKCLTVRPGEDESDMFPNPDAAKHC